MFTLEPAALALVVPHRERQESKVPGSIVQHEPCIQDASDSNDDRGNTIHKAVESHRIHQRHQWRTYQINIRCCGYTKDVICDANQVPANLMQAEWETGRLDWTR